MYSFFNYFSVIFISSNKLFFYSFENAYEENISYPLWGFSGNKIDLTKLRTIYLIYMLSKLKSYATFLRRSFK